jgi:D-alanyl-D-alanine carboxypeptidase (penicillin-binding protein 5/6)
MTLLFFLPFYLLAASLNVKIESPYVCVMNQKTGKLIYGKNMDKEIFPASITKLAMILYIMEECEMDENKVIECLAGPLKVVSEKSKIESNFSLPPYILEDDGATIDLLPGEKLTVGSLIRAVMVASANDAANILAGLYAENISDFMFQVNKYCRQIGCKNTHFVNPHGLHHPDHHTTAYDLAIIMRRAASFPYLKMIMSTLEYEIAKTNKSPSRKLKNTNALINPKSEYYTPYVVGGKTGYHHRAKYNIAAFAEKDGRELITILNKAETSAERFGDCRKIFTAAFDESLQQRVLFNAKEAKFPRDLDWASMPLYGILKEDSILSFFPSEEEEVEVKLDWLDLNPPIKKGDLVATINVYNQSGVPLQSHNVYAENDVDYKMLYRLRMILNFFIEIFGKYTTLVVTSCIILLILYRGKRKKLV